MKIGIIIQSIAVVAMVNRHMADAAGWDVIQFITVLKAKHNITKIYKTFSIGTSEYKEVSILLKRANNLFFSQEISQTRDDIFDSLHPSCIAFEVFLNEKLLVRTHFDGPERHLNKREQLFRFGKRIIAKGN